MAAEIHFPVMGSTAHVIVVGGPPTLPSTARLRLHELEQAWSRFIAVSEVSRLNAAAGRPVPVSGETRLLVRRALEGHRFTGGRFDPTVLPAGEALALATTNAARAFGLDAGVLAPGKLADLILIDLASPFLFPGHHLEADLVYAAHGRAVRATICDGQVLMEHGTIADEAEIRAEVLGRMGRLMGG